MAMINFYRGNKKSYQATGKHLDAVYFALDTKELLMNGVSYGGSGITDVVVEGDNLVIKTTTGNKQVPINDIMKYSSSLGNTIATVNDFGGIKKGTKVEDLKKKTISQILDDLLFPTVNPTFTNPSASISSTKKTIQEVGSKSTDIPSSSSDFSTSFNRGSIMLGGTEQNKRAGELIPGSSFIYINTDNNKVYPAELPEGQTKYYYRASYQAGPQPKDSKGGSYSTSLSAGHVDSAPFIITGVYPYFTNKNGSSFEKLPLTDKTTLTNINFVSETSGHKHTFKIPAKYTVTKIEGLNTLSGKYEVLDKTALFGESTENITVQNKSVSYKVFTRKDKGLNGPVTYQITFTK